MTLQKNLEKECFCSIDELPIWNWWKITDTGDLRYLYKKDVDNLVGLKKNMTLPGQ